MHIRPLVTQNTVLTLKKALSPSNSTRSVERWTRCASKQLSSKLVMYVHVHICRSLCITCMHTHLTRAHLIQQYSQYVFAPSKHPHLHSPPRSTLTPLPSTFIPHQAPSPPTKHPHHLPPTSLTPTKQPSPPTKQPHTPQSTLIPTSTLTPPPSTLIAHQAPSPHSPSQAPSPTYPSLGTQTQRCTARRTINCQEPRCCNEVGGHSVLLEVGVQCGEVLVELG